MSFQPLLAKSRPRSGAKAPPTISEHCRDVAEAAEAVWDAIEPALEQALQQPSGSLRKVIRPLLLAAAYLHDIGKANSAFQGMLVPSTDRRSQPVRHEILSAVLLTDDAFFGRALGGIAPAERLWPVIWAVAGHHLRMGDPANGATLYSTSNAPKTISVPLSSPQLAELIGAAADAMGYTFPTITPADTSFDPLDDSEHGLEQRVDHYVATSVKMWHRLRKLPDVKLTIALLKALLIAADVAGSAETADRRRPKDWVAETLNRRIEPAALDDVIAEGTGLAGPRDFQVQVGASDTPATLVIAGCGNGKTTAAFMWAKKWARGRKLFFTYPTTGTASAGYEDYLFPHKRLASALIHGRASVDLEAMQTTPEDDMAEQGLRVETLRAWDREAIVCTVDTVLGLMQNQKRPLFSFPAIATGAIVFDEIHSYDQRLFGELLRFLETFPGVPVLLMSASIPPSRLERLKTALTGRLGPVVRGDAALEGHARYRLERRASPEDCRSDLGEAIRAGQKVLWVCNTVKDAVRTARDVQNWFRIEPIVFHSRFRYRDRVGRQKEVVERFQPDSPGPVIVVATQVCEMSLDISANLLVTADCPLPSLVQRLGRLNRFADRDDPWPCLIYPFEGEPYNERAKDGERGGDYRVEMAAARSAVAKLHGQPCRQRDLADRLDKMIRNEDLDTYSAWRDDGWLTESAPAREGDQSITIIREEDLESVAEKLGPLSAGRWTSQSLVPWTIPMPLRRQFRYERRATCYPVAPFYSVMYSEQEGAEWQLTSNP